MDEITINITLLDRPYRLSVARADEEKVRKAGNLINERIKYYSKHYAYKDVQDLLSMTALQFATSVVKMDAELPWNRSLKIWNCLFSAFGKLNTINTSIGLLALCKNRPHSLRGSTFWCRWTFAQRGGHKRIIWSLRISKSRQFLFVSSSFFE